MDEPVAGVIYNGLRKQLKPTKTTNAFERRVIPVTRTQIKFLLKLREAFFGGVGARGLLSYFFLKCIRAFSRFMSSGRYLFEFSI